MATPTLEFRDGVVADYEIVCNQIDTWPPAARARLAQHIITSLVPENVPKPKKRNSVAEIFGSMAIDGVPAPTDEEVEQMIEEYRLEKYG